LPAPLLGFDGGPFPIFPVETGNFADFLIAAPFGCKIGAPDQGLATNSRSSPKREFLPA
jgi:hypothetical protein